MRRFATNPKNLYNVIVPGVWVYERGKAYNPGHKRHRNPCRRPVSTVGTAEGHYAFEEKDGVVDLYTFKVENPVSIWRAVSLEVDL